MKVIISTVVASLICSQHVELSLASLDVGGGAKRGGSAATANGIGGGSSSFYRHPSAIPKLNTLNNNDDVPQSNSNNNKNTNTSNNNKNNNLYLKRHYSKGNVKLASGENQNVGNVALSYVKSNSDQVEVMDLATIMKNANRRKYQQQQGRRKRKTIQNNNNSNNQPKLLENGGQHDDSVVDTIDNNDLDEYDDDLDNNGRRRNKNDNSFINNRTATQILKTVFRHMSASLLTVVMISSFVVLVKLTMTLSASKDSISTVIEEAVIMRRALGMMSSNNNAFANISNIEQFVQSRIGDTIQKSRLLFTKKVVTALFSCTTLLYFVESALCSTRKYLSNVVPPQDFQKVINNIRHSEPVIKWHVECYHYRRWFSESNEVRKRLHEEKVITHRASKTFRYKKWKNTINVPKDYGPAASSAANRNNKNNGGNNGSGSGRSSYSIAPYIRAKLLNCVTFQDVNALSDYEKQLNEFLDCNGKRDYHMNHYTTMTVNGNLSKVLVVPTGIGTNRMAREHVYWIFTVLGLTVPYRIWFSRYSGEANIMVTKEICTR